MKRNFIAVIAKFIVTGSPTSQYKIKFKKKTETLHPVLNRSCRRKNPRLSFSKRLLRRRCHAKKREKKERSREESAREWETGRRIHERERRRPMTGHKQRRRERRERRERDQNSENLRNQFQRLENNFTTSRTRDGRKGERRKGERRKEKRG